MTAEPRGSLSTRPETTRSSAATSATLASVVRRLRIRGTCSTSWTCRSTRRGRILVAYADGCVSPACIAGADRNGDGFLDARDNDAADKAAIAGSRADSDSFAEFDPPVPAAPAPPQLTAALQGTVGVSRLVATGRRRIGDYRLPRVPQRRRGRQPGPRCKFLRRWQQRPAISYRVSAINAVGEGPKSPAVLPTVPASGCTLPGILVAEDTIDDAPNAPLQPQVDVKTVHVAEPYGDGSGRLHFTVATAGGAAPPNSQWYVIWQRTAPDSNHDRNYVAMKTGPLSDLTFEYGRVSYPLITTSPAPNQGNIPTRVGAATGSYDAATGVIRISVPTASVDNVGAGASLLGVEARAFLGRGDGLPISQTFTSDFSPAGSYTLVGNASCRQPPQAPTTLTAKSGQHSAALAWADNSNDETVFLIERSTALDSGFVPIATVGANMTTIVDSSVVRKTTYFYRVRAARGLARSAYTNVASVRVK